jgi:hypothetical protein
MAQKITPEQCGKGILDIYRGDGIRPGEMILLQSLRTRFLVGSWRAEDFDAGLKWCIDKEFLEKRKLMYFLTESGFAAM